LSNVTESIKYQTYICPYYQWCIKYQTYICPYYQWCMKYQTYICPYYQWCIKYQTYICPYYQWCIKYQTYIWPIYITNYQWCIELELLVTNCCLQKCNKMKLNCLFQVMFWKMLVVSQYYLYGKYFLRWGGDDISLVLVDWSRNPG
jgi:hypothetical protein